MMGGTLKRPAAGGSFVRGSAKAGLGHAAPCIEDRQCSERNRTMQYEPNRESLKQYTVPEWFKDAK